MQTILGGLKLDIELVYDRQEKPKPNNESAKRPESTIQNPPRDGSDVRTS